MVAYRLVDIMGRASAPNILGVTVRELDKLVDIFEPSQKFTSLRDPSAAITWSRELMGVSKKLLTPSVVEAVVKKVNQKRITNSKDLRKLRTVLPDPVSRPQFLSDRRDIESAMLRVAPVAKQSKTGLPGHLDAAVEAMKGVPWTALQELKGDPDILKKIDYAEVLLQSLRKALS
jgi:ParB family chromosome partitioning protein